MPDEQPARSGIAQRLAWFALLWIAGVATVGLLSLAIKWALR